MKRPKRAILDGDIIMYRASYWADTEGVEYLDERLEKDIKDWTPEGVDEVIVALSTPRAKNWRRQVWPKYKEQRDDRPEPDSKTICKEIIVDNFSVRCVETLEADDLMGMGQSSGWAISVTIDKDLISVPGWLWNPHKDDGAAEISEVDADFAFYRQWMMGDMTDNIPGLWKVGPKKAEKFLNSHDKDEWDELIMDMYALETRPEDKQPGMDRAAFGHAMAQCVRILRKGEYDPKTKEVKLWYPEITGVGA